MEKGTVCGRVSCEVGEGGRSIFSQLVGGRLKMVWQVFRIPSAFNLLDFLDVMNLAYGYCGFQYPYAKLQYSDDQEAQVWKDEGCRFGIMKVCRSTLTRFAQNPSPFLGRFAVYGAQNQFSTASPHY